MKKYNVILHRTEYYYTALEIEANSEDEAQDIAWDQSGNWQLADAEEYTDYIEEA